MAEPLKIPYKLSVNYGSNKIYGSIRFHMGSNASVSHRHDGIGTISQVTVGDHWVTEDFIFHLARDKPFVHVCNNGYRVILNRQDGTLTVQQPESN